MRVLKPDLFNNPAKSLNDLVSWSKEFSRSLRIDIIFMVHVLHCVTDLSSIMLTSLATLLLAVASTISTRSNIFLTDLCRHWSILFNLFLPSASMDCLPLKTTSGTITATSTKAAATPARSILAFLVSPSQRGVCF